MLGHGYSFRIENEHLSAQARSPDQIAAWLNAHPPRQICGAAMSRAKFWRYHSRRQADTTQASFLRPEVVGVLLAATGAD